LGSLNKSDGKGVKFLDRPQVLTVGVLVSLAVIFVIVVLITSYLELILDFANSVIKWKAVP
jgi:hypothetical protein